MNPRCTRYKGRIVTKAWKRRYGKAGESPEKEATALELLADLLSHDYSHEGDRKLGRAITVGRKLLGI